MDWIKHFQRTVILYLVFSLFQYAANETTNIPPLNRNCTDNYLEKPSNCQSFVEEKNYLLVEIFYSCYFSGGKFNQITFKKDDDILKSHALTKGKDLEKDIIGVNGETGNIEILFTVNDKIGHKCSSHMINFLNKPGSSLGEYCEVSSDCVAMLDHTYCDDTNFCDCGYNYCRSENECVLCPGLGENCSLSLECSGSGVACNSYTTICECKEGYSAYNGFCVENSILSTDTAARVAVICSGIIALSLVIGIAWNAIKRHSFIRALLARRRDEQRTQQRERDGTSSSLDDEIEVRLRDRPPTYNYAVEDKPPTYEEFDSDLNYRVESIVIPSAPGMDDLQNNQAAADSPQNNQAAADSPQNNQAAADSPQNPERVGHTNPAFDNETDHQSEDL